MADPTTTTTPPAPTTATATAPSRESRAAPTSSTSSTTTPGKATPASPAAPAATPIRPRRTRNGAAQQRPRSWRDLLDRRWITGQFSFSRDRIAAFFRTMLWVAPLTLLIWVYAEREQVTPFENETVPFELHISGPDKVVRAEPGVGSSFVINFRGPRARVVEVLQELRGDGDFPQGLRLNVDPNLPPGSHRIATLPLVTNHPVLTQSGITVTSVSPPSIDIVVDEVMEAELPVTWDPQQVRNLGPATAFHPAVVRIRGPRDVIQNKRAEEFRAVADLSAREELRTPGVKEVRDVPVELPPALRDQVTVLSPSPAVVDATLDVLDRDAEIVIPAMPVWPSAPTPEFFEEFDLRYTRSLPNVRLIGPKDQIDLLGQPGAPQPRAQLELSREDQGERRRKRLLFVHLPPDVRVSDEDRNRTVEFDLVPRTGAQTDR